MYFMKFVVHRCSLHKNIFEALAHRQILLAHFVVYEAYFY